MIQNIKNLYRRRLHDLNHRDGQMTKYQVLVVTQVPVFWPLHSYCHFKFVELSGITHRKWPTESRRHFQRGNIRWHVCTVRHRPHLLCKFREKSLIISLFVAFLSTPYNVLCNVHQRKFPVPSFEFSLFHHFHEIFKEQAKAREFMFQ